MRPQVEGFFRCNGGPLAGKWFYSSTDEFAILRTNPEGFYWFRAGTSEWVWSTDWDE